jgi:hypothetical protein
MTPLDQIEAFGVTNTSVLIALDADLTPLRTRIYPAPGTGPVPIELIAFIRQERLYLIQTPNSTADTTLVLHAVSERVDMQFKIQVGEEIPLTEGILKLPQERLVFAIRHKDTDPLSEGPFLLFKLNGPTVRISQAWGLELATGHNPRRRFG